MWFHVHLTSIGAGFGAAVVFTVLLFSAVFMLFISHNAVHLRYLVLQAVFLPYLIGYTMYTSGTEPGWVLMWFRICLTGLIFTPLALELFLESLAGIRRPLHQLIVGIATLLFLLILWGSPSLFAVGDIVHHAGGFTSVVKGPLFPVFVYAALGSSIVSLGWFFRMLLQLEDLRRRNRAVLIGLVVWFGSSAIEALGALKIIDVFFPPWLGPTTMVIALGIHLGAMAERNAVEIVKQTQENENLRNRMKLDPLTRLYSREFFNSVMEIEAEAWARNPQEHSILFLDADNFKGLNDEYGHITGDHVLQMIGEIIRTSVRRSDVPCRFGGDEFIILLRNCGPEPARSVANKIIDQYARGLKDIIADIPEGFSGLSVGIASTSLLSAGSRDLVVLADEAMYRSKKEGKNRVVVAEAG